MAKSKNHTAHNQSYKAHRNPVKKIKSSRHPSLKGVDAKYLRNMRFSRKHNKSTAQQKKTFEKRKVEGRPDKRPSLH
ncbi:60S ribosomal protein L29 [Amphibalanus amphitrite]|uniref:60S ribosomal protein L29 n=1 Tax=Amphibalanus amphitrite TaxID=1232801 RepID=A0A6A4VMG6_AMPAM|nr:60S ribosomal protein L29-1-like [Amphibalanus amphitrite]XP_043197640.1 60S ribosomal protein L29-1-like [Amphibalanus amphitrite]KAF0297387.1 60S ribosomal protein L29 [Amphibalanus amphitrite]